MTRTQIRLCAAAIGLIGGGLLAFYSHDYWPQRVQAEEKMIKATQPLPALDLAVPAKTETATFALG